MLSSLVLASCSTWDTSQEASISVDNCGDSVTLDAPPENVTLLRSAPVATLSELGVLDKVTTRAGQYPDEYYDDNTNMQLDAIPSLTDKTDASGHLQISREEVVATGTDLVLGDTDTINRQTLAQSDIPQLEEPALCGDIDAPVTWDNVWEEIELYGTVFGREDTAESAISDLQARLGGITGDHDKSVAAVFPTIGGGVTYAYGGGSMATPLIERTGATNVYADQDERVFEVTAEDLVDRNPDVILALYPSGDGEQYLDAVNDLPGIGTTTAGREQNILPMLLNFADPPTPLAVDGLETLDAYLEGLE
ncbi:MAG TPA: ABC transporter substrate-binding protein [Candidatus Corynebacterium avicola]|uniref:ABC transporter substrate-binding protein n=1 Tax=Candidatus Corynebacterium avicola TaxID=2838527 RepID=A0A9D1RQS0_9CORY|nr:ABC transporter substrate-binding protein [Candidatus Corynebacterium avicola]